MLTKMRESFTGTFALVLLGMIGLSFVFFGLSPGTFGQSIAATINGVEIGAGYFEQRYRIEVNNNPQLGALEGPARQQVRRNLLNQLVVETLLDHYLETNGYRVSDEQITNFVQATPEFQIDGQFDMGAYRAYLSERGREPIEFELSQRSALRQQQLQLSIGATALVTPAEYRRYLNIMAEQRVVTIASIAQDDVANEVVISDDMVTGFYDENPTMFQLPESADVEYIELTREGVAEGIEVSEEDLLAYYEQNQDRFLQDEYRRARHILVLFGDDEDAAEVKANDALARAQAGEAFEDLAAELSDDSGTSSQGGDLGTLTREQFPGELGAALFNMDEGGLAGPLRSEFGFHVVRLDEILEPGPQPFDQVRGELLSDLRQREAEDRFNDLERALSDALFDNADMAEMSERSGLEIKAAAGITRSGGEPFGANQAAIDAIFDEIVLTGGQISEVTELDANRSALFRVTNYNEATRIPLDDVRDEVVATLTAQQAEQILSGRAEQMLEALAGNEDFGIAAEAAGFAVAEPQLLSRTDENIDRALLFEVFTVGKPTGEAPLTGRVRQLDGGYAVYSLDAVLPGRPESIPLAERDRGKQMMAQQSGFSDFRAFLRQVYDDAEIEINEDLLAADDLFQ